MTQKLDAGSTFPSMQLQIAGGGLLNIPEDLTSDHTVVLFYRGHW